MSSAEIDTRGRAAHDARIRAQARAPIRDTLRARQMNRMPIRATWRVRAAKQCARRRIRITRFYIMRARKEYVAEEPRLRGTSICYAAGIIISCRARSCYYARADESRHEEYIIDVKHHH